MTLGNEFRESKNTEYLEFEDDEPSFSVGSTKEQLLLNDLQVIANEVKDLEQMKRHFSRIILQNLEELDFTGFLPFKKYNIKESSIKKTASPSIIRGLNVVSVDGSSVVKNFMNADFSFLKAIAVKYYFYKNHAARIEYFPDLSGFNNYSVQGNFLNHDENEVDIKVSMDMNFMEINLLNKMIEKSSNIDLIIIDGSIVIMPINLIFSKDLETSKRYDKLLREYQKLYTNCIEKGIILVGSIKDTRTSALCHLVRDSIMMLKPSHSHLADFTKVNYREVFEYFSDLDLFNRLLKKSERSCVFNCKREIEKIRDTGLKSEIPNYFPYNFYAFYLKTAKYDNPCRIEFFMDESDSYEKASQKADLVASLLLPMSSLNDHYGLPIPQIEAHRRAVFKPSEINILFNSLKRTLNGYGINLMEKRRNRRPF